MATLVDGPSFPNAALSLPIADRTSLIGLSGDGVRAWSLAKADEYRRFALTVLSVYNAVAPIHRLPPEILSKIFEGCWTDRESLRIGHVCRWWRSVLLDTKQFWADAVNGESRPFIKRLEAVLERSAPLPVEPSFRHFSPTISRCLVPHAGRIRSLEVSLTEGVIFELWSCLNSGMPSLTTFTIKLSDQGILRWILRVPVEELSLSPTALPLLTRVSAPVALLPGLALPSLRHVTLNNSVECDGPNGRLESECFWGALAVCADNLRTLVLLEATPWVCRTVTPFSLPALGHLRIRDTTRRCSLFLPRLALPDTTHIHCTNIDGGSLCSTILTTASNSAQSAIWATDRVEITETPKISSVRCYVEDEESLRLDVEFQRGPAHRQSVGLLHPDLVQVFRDRARVTHLMVHDRNDTGRRTVAWRAFPHLVHAEVRGQHTRHAVRSLAPDGEDPDSDSTEVLCPDLRTLTVDFPCRVQQLIGGADSLVDILEKTNVAELHLGGRCAELERVLELRSQMGTRLTRLELGCTFKQSGPAGLNFEGVLDPPSDPDWVSWRPIVEPLEKLVDGPVVFTGYRFFPANGVSS